MTTASTKTRQPLRALAALLAASALAACGTSTVSGADEDPGSAAVVQTKDTDGLYGTQVDDPPLRVADVTLTNTEGKRVRLNDLASTKVTVLFFGFTSCDDVCPTTMADLATARRALPTELAEQVDIVFVTVDPRRDSPKVLRSWLDQFGTDVTGLRGPTSVVNRAERSLYADQSSAGAETTAAPKTDGHQHEHESGSDEGGHDEVSHSGSVYIFGPQEETALYTGGTTPKEYAADMGRLLRRS